jgi:ADP-ribosylglycohydrolase
MSDSQPNDRQRLIGGLLGVIVGDAIGVPWEFQPANTAPRPTPAVGFQTFDQPPGTWSDDGSMTLALLESLLEVGWDLNDQGRRFLAWFDDAQYTVSASIRGSPPRRHSIASAPAPLQQRRGATATTHSPTAASCAYCPWR